MRHTFRTKRKMLSRVVIRASPRGATSAAGATAAATAAAVRLSSSRAPAACRKGNSPSSSSSRPQTTLASSSPPSAPRRVSARASPEQFEGDDARYADEDMNYGVDDRIPVTVRRTENGIATLLASWTLIASVSFIFSTPDLFVLLSLLPPPPPPPVPRHTR